MSLQEGSRAVETWLRGEHPYQFGKFDTIYGQELVARREYIANEEIPNKWHRSVIFRTDGAWQLANQQLLKVCAASRAVVVYDACILGEDRDTTSEGTFADLHEHFEHLSLSELPDTSALYNRDYETVFANKEPPVVMLRSGELAITGLLESLSQTGSIEVPKPGLPSGQLM